MAMLAAAVLPQSLIETMHFSGSMRHLAATAPTAVASLPCWELFDAQDDAYRASVLGDGAVRIGIEAAVRMGWDRYIGADGIFVGMTGFGASAPAGDLFKHFGITAEKVVEEAKKKLT